MGGNITDILLTISNTAFTIAVIFGVLVGILFFRFHIATVVEELSGRGAGKSVERMRTEPLVQENKSREDTSPLSQEMSLIQMETVIIVHTDEDIWEGVEHDKNTAAAENEKRQKFLGESAYSYADWNDGGAA